ncbi:MAG: uroporphyrinogen decarboxylase family protein [Sedimentisphaerales bacterium]|nr:uroporphyrinogen decarboxylase family protein [Sedimentisphaerales bacterium]
MKDTSQFNTQAIDPQGTQVEPVWPDRFDYEAYCDYEAKLLERCRLFWQSDSGVAVYRRFRIPQCFTWMCRDMQASLAYQLGALQASMAYKADIPNFLEPWYGIGTLASAFGIDYVWPAGQAPVVPQRFDTIEQALEVLPMPVDQTPIGRHTLQMIEYSVDKSNGRLPISLTDTQSPLNALSFLVRTEAFYLAFMDTPQQLSRILDRLVPLQIAFTQRQLQILGDTIVWPGHGFASTRVFSGLGMSDDIMTCISPGQYRQFGIPGIVQCGQAFGGAAVHSCGNWQDKLAVVRDIPGLVMVDAAFTSQTDPSPNDAELFGQAFAGTGIVVNSRMVGNKDTVIQTVKSLWRPGLKLIVVTYCQDPREQAEVYDAVHSICSS